MDSLIKKTLILFLAICPVAILQSAADQSRGLGNAMSEAFDNDRSRIRAAKLHWLAMHYPGSCIFDERKGMIFEDYYRRFLNWSSAAVNELDGLSDIQRLDKFDQLISPEGQQMAKLYSVGLNRNTPQAMSEMFRDKKNNRFLGLFFRQK